jgi:hypothetical protein
LFDADCDGLHGEEAAYEIISWDDAEIEMDAHCRRQEQIITVSLEHLLIDAFRRKDEKLHAAVAAPVPAKPVIPLEEEKELFPGKVEAAVVSPEAAARLKLVEILSRHPGVQEFALFDPTGFLENRNDGVCRLEDFEPELFFAQLGDLDGVQSFGSFSHMVLTTTSRCHCLLFKMQNHQVAVRLLKGQRPAEVMKQVKQSIRG